MTGTPGRRLRGQVTRARVVNAVLILALVLVVAGSALIARHTQGEQASFAGTDSIATDLIASQGHTSWFDPLLRPGSSEVESGLFALQAALGAGVLGYCLGRLHGRRLRERRSGAGVQTRRDERRDDLGVQDQTPKAHPSTGADPLPRQQDEHPQGLTPGGSG
ncbi:MAG: energy-coupling factor ABC transporter substrate-binding protein [Actinomycetales bacterium]